MAIGGLTSGLNVTLARLNAIESNFRSLDNIALELDLRQGQTVQNADFKTILDAKINNTENKISETENNSEILPVYDDEIVPVENQTVFEAKEEAIPLSQSENDTLTSVENPRVDMDEADINEYKTDKVDLKSKILINPKSENIDEIIETLSNKYNIDSDFVKAVIKQESGFNPQATSKKGAMGLMQLMPATAKSLGVQNAYDPWENIEGGVKHLRGLLDKYGNNQELALAAYNAGSGAVKRYGGIPPYKETQNYVKSIMGAYNRTKEAKI